MNYLFERRAAVRLGCAATWIVVLAAGWGCNRQPNVRVRPEEEAAPPLASTVRVSDPSAAKQLVSGFYGLESNSYRWTKREFSVVLRTPPGAAAKGGKLKFQFTVPDIVIRKVGNIALSATANGSPLPPESYTIAGEATYERVLPLALLGAETMRVDFSLDKAIPPSGDDKRELGVVAAAVGVEAN